MFYVTRVLFLVLSLGAFCGVQELAAQTRVFPSPNAQVEAHIAVNPTDPKNLVATALTTSDNDTFHVGYYYTLNGGQQWNGSENISGDISAGDPVVAFDPDGTAYLLYQILSASGLYLHKSTVGGATWSSRMTVVQVDPSIGKVDRPWIAISPLRNAAGMFDIYVAHAYIEGTVHVIQLRKSTNGGTSFSHVHEVQLPERIQGTTVGVGPSGEVFLAWAELGQSNEVTRIHAKRSTDGGFTFLNATSVTAYQTGSKVGTSEYFLKNQKIRVDSYPRLALDRSYGSYRGQAYIVWSGKQSPTGNPDILMIRWKKNTDGSFGWTGVQVVHGSLEEQWMPAVDVGPDGVLSVLFYSSMMSETEPIYTLLKHSSDGGQSFGNVIPMGTPGGFQIESRTTFLGDYHGASNWLGKGYGIWTENRNHGSDNKRQIYFKGEVIPEQIPSGYQKVQVDQLDNAGQSFEKFARWNQGAFTNYKAPYDFLFQTNSSEVLRAKQDFKIETTEKYNLWLNYSDVQNHQSFAILPAQLPIKSQFRPANNATIQTQLIDGGSGGTIEFRDPWLIDYNDPLYGNNLRNRGQADALWNSKASPFNPNTNPSGPGSEYKGVVLNQVPNPNDPNIPYYSIRALGTQTINGFTWYFHNWTSVNADITSPLNVSGSYYESPVVFTSTNATVSARYKAHMGTGSPTLSDAKNQRRLLIEADNWWLLVYESGGDIWLTASRDNGVTWTIEERMNTKQGVSLNPSLSNIVYNGSEACGILSWVEQNDAGAWEVHLQSFRMFIGGGATSHPVWYGWSGDGLNRSTSNHKILSTPYVPRNNARPVIQLTGGTPGAVTLRYAFERSGSGVCSGTQSYTFAQDLENPVILANHAVSTNTQDRYPVIIYYPTAQGVPERLNLYYIGVDGFPLRVFQSTFDGVTKQALPTSAYNEFTYVSLQGAVNSLSASFALVADGETSGGSRVTVLYTKPSYNGSGAPTVYAYYPAMTQPTVMVENTSNFGQPSTYIFFKSTSDNNWYQITPSQSSSLIGTNIAGMLAREQISTANRTSIAVRTTTTPSRIERYSGTGQLSKTEGATTTTHIKAFRHLQDETGKEHLVTLNFTGSEVRVNDETYNKATVCAMQILQPRKDGIIVTKADSLDEPLGVDVVRGGTTICSYLASSWQSLNAADLEDFVTGDAIRVTGEENLVRGYYEVSIISTRLAKGSPESPMNPDSTAKRNQLVEREFSISVYPNPFNASTLFRISLPRLSDARLAVYDLLGREVAQLLDGSLEAGDHSIRLDASRLASGMYVYRLQLDRKVYSGKLLLMK